MSFGHKNDSRMMSEINVTPFVDVMLVLLIIFMITTPLMLNDIKLKLPRTKRVSSLNLNSKQVVLSITREGDFFLGKDRIDRSDLILKVNQLLGKLKSKMVFIRADYGLKYGVIAQAMSDLKATGVSNISLITEIEGKK
jgi:biopolymer transport protein ExbD